jgi:hypothetical protein
MFLTAYVHVTNVSAWKLRTLDVCTWKFLISRVVSRSTLSWINQKGFSNASPKWRSAEHVVVLSHVAFGTCFWCAAFAYLLRASLMPSSWCWWIGRPGWAPFWWGFCACAPGHCSWSVWARLRNSTASSTSGSSWSISVHRWLAGQNCTNLALMVLGRLSWFDWHILKWPLPYCSL